MEQKEGTGQRVLLESHSSEESQRKERKDEWGRRKNVKKKNKQKTLLIFYLVFDTNARNYSHKMVVIGYWGYNQAYDSDF